jgi:uncharacterized membrane protein YdcZ (DUF606 family)
MPFIKEAPMPNEPLPDDIRNVWQNQPLENRPMPIDEVRSKAQQFEKRVSRRNLREYIGGAIGIAIFTFYVFKFPSPMARTGSLLIIAGLVVIMIQIYKRASPGRLPVDLALTASLEFHRRELVRQRDLLRSVWWWYLGPLVPGLVVFVAGIAPPRGAAAVINAVPFFCILGLVIWLNHRAALRLDRQIAELEGLESQS